MTFIYLKNIQEKWFAIFKSFVRNSFGTYEN